MLGKIVLFIVRMVLSLRYRISINGIDEIRKNNQDKGILFLPTHPALIDPVILMAWLFPLFKQRFLADRDQMRRPVIHFFAKYFKVIPIPDPIKYGKEEPENIKRSILKCAELLKEGRNVLIYPSGHILKNRFEQIAGNSALEKIHEYTDDFDIVLVKTQGLWGSAFSRSDGGYPSVEKILKKGLLFLLTNLIFFGPRRKVEISLYRKEDLPFEKGRIAVNKALENEFNEKAPLNTFVSYFWWNGYKTKVLPEPEKKSYKGNVDDISDSIKEIVLEFLKDLSGVKEIKLEHHLSKDLGLDSLKRVDITTWIESEFGFNVPNPDSLKKVSDVMFAASGETLSNEVKLLKKINNNWFKRSKLQRPYVDFDTITDCFLEKCKKAPDLVIAADQMVNTKTYRQLLMSIYVLKKNFSDINGQNVGLMLPAGVSSLISYLSLLFASKTPVMINWTVGKRNLLHSLEKTELEKIITSSLLVSKLEASGVDLESVKENFIYLEDIVLKVNVKSKIKALIASYFPSSFKVDNKPDDTAVVLFTSGSESLPKAVPLSHKNILTNVKDILNIVRLDKEDRLLGFLPPFHSFGITVTMMLTTLTGIKVVFYPNPTESGTLSKMVKHYGATIISGTPTFLSGILKAVSDDELETLRMVVTGAEKCPDSVYERFSERCPDASILEGYGITECSPVVSVNREKCIKKGSIGKVLPSVEYVIVDEAIKRRVEKGEKGMLLVSGDSIFSGYIKHDGDSPFVLFEGKNWYKTGDLVKEDENKILTFSGRLKRFIKLGGEMVSMPAIEEVILSCIDIEEEVEGPLIAVKAFGESNPELVLFTVVELDRETVNSFIRNAGLSGLHNIRKVIKIDEIPCLGTGKVNYRELSL